MAIYGFGRANIHNVNSDAAAVDGLGGAGTAAQAASLVATLALQKAEDAQGLLGRLERGEISRDIYLDRRVDEAIAPFVQTLGNNQIEFMRTALRDQLESDPVLVDLVRRATELAGPR